MSDRRIDQYNNDKHLAKLNVELSRAMKQLYTVQYDNEGKGELVPLTPDAETITNKIRKQIYDYQKTQYPDLFSSD